MLTSEAPWSWCRYNGIEKSTYERGSSKGSAFEEENEEKRGVEGVGCCGQGLGWPAESRE